MHAVANAADRFDVLALSGVDLLAQIRDVHAHHVIVAVPVASSIGGTATVCPQTRV